MSTLKVDLTGRNAIVTGASRGIGRAIATALGANGAHVIVNYRSNVQAAEETVNKIQSAGGKAWPVQADISQPDNIARLFATAKERFGDRLDILINNAGGPNDLHPLATMPKQIWDECLATNLTAVFLCTQAAWPLLPDRTGRIINVTSISARSGGGPHMTQYAAAKGGLSNFIRACAKEFAPRGITVNGLAPGVIYTDAHKFGTPPEELADLKGKIPLARLGVAEDCVGAVLMLCSDQGAFITGEIIEINGGMMMN